MCVEKGEINQGKGHYFFSFFFKKKTKNERGEFRKIFGEFRKGRAREGRDEGMMIHLTFRNM